MAGLEQIARRHLHRRVHREVRIGDQLELVQRRFRARSGDRAPGELELREPRDLGETREGEGQDSIVAAAARPARVVANGIVGEHFVADERTAHELRELRLLQIRARRIPRRNGIQLIPAKVHAEFHRMRSNAM